MSVLIEAYTLSNGNEIPKIGFGVAAQGRRRVLQRRR
jgi:hypothetical protein